MLAPSLQSVSEAFPRPCLAVQNRTMLFRGISIRELAIQSFRVEAKSRNVNVNAIDNTERDTLIPRGPSGGTARPIQWAVMK